jgi:hypothetical protein
MGVSTANAGIVKPQNNRDLSRGGGESIYDNVPVIRDEVPNPEDY